MKRSLAILRDFHGLVGLYELHGWTLPMLQFRYIVFNGLVVGLFMRHRNVRGGLVLSTLYRV